MTVNAGTDVGKEGPRSLLVQESSGAVAVSVDVKAHKKLDAALP